MGSDAQVDKLAGAVDRNLAVFFFQVGGYLELKRLVLENFFGAGDR